MGVESDGVQAVEEFVFSRYWMFIQVYFHKTRRIFDYYLVNFLKSSLPNGKYPTNIEQYLEYTDSRILEMIKNNASNNLWARRILERKSISEVFVSTPHQLSENEGDFSDYHKLGWIDQQLRKNFPVDDEPDNYYIDQAKTFAAKYQISPRTHLSSETEEEANKLYAIPIKDKHTGKIQPIQNYSLPIKGLSDLKINIIRVYANKEHEIDGVTAYEKVKNYLTTIDAGWLKYVEEVKETEQKYRDMIKEKEELKMRFNN